jgi:prepilin signal peptidase PulO-like enzyme (type II secretory pathway)
LNPKLAIQEGIVIENFSYFDLKTQIFFIGILALIFGSFASLLSYRLAKNQPIVFTRSNCVSCGYKLIIFNLIPLISWMIQMGKCSKCKTKISIRYPLIELTFLISFLIIFFALDQKISYKMLLYFAIAATLIVMTVVDLEEYFIPNSTQYFLAILVSVLLIMQGGTNAILANLTAAFLYAGFGLLLFTFFYFTTKLEALGVDDIKFFFIAGLMLGIKDFLSFMILSGVFGIFFGGVWQKIKKEETFPFAPALCLSAFLCLLFGKKINPVDILGSLLFF